MRSVCGSVNRIKRDIIEMPVTTAFGLGAVEREKKLKIEAYSISLRCYLITIMRKKNRNSKPLCIRKLCRV